MCVRVGLGEGNDHATADQLALTRVVSDVWLSSLVAWVTGRLSAAGVTDRLELTVRLLLEREDDASPGV